MRVTNNLFVFNSYKRNTQNSQMQYKPSMQNPIDRVSFSARFKAPKLDTPIGIFNQATQDTVQSIYTKLKTIRKYFADMVPTKASQIKQEYEPLLIYKGNKGHTFVLKDDPDGIETLTVARSNKNSNLLRLVVRDKDKNATHYLIDGLDKTVANVNQNTPFIIPANLRYMSPEQVASSGIKRYIALAHEELTKYTDFLENYGKPKKIQEAIKEIKKPVEVQQIAKIVEIKPNKLIKIFESTPEELPKHISSQISPVSGKVVAFSLKTEDGGTLRVLKTMNSEYGDQLKYISIRKTLPTGEKKFISLDLLNKEFLKTDSITGKPVIMNDVVYHYTPEEIAKNNVAEEFNTYMKEIFRQAKDGEELSQEVTVLKIKEKPQPKQKIEDISIEDLEDKRLNSLLEKNHGELSSTTEMPVTKKRGRKPKSQQVEVQNSEASTLPKKRGRKPKVQNTEPQQPKIKIDDEISAEIAKHQSEIISKANKDADNLAELYFKTFMSRFKETLGQKMADFKSKYDELFNI